MAVWSRTTPALVPRLPLCAGGPSTPYIALSDGYVKALTRCQSTCEIRDAKLTR